MNIEYSKLAVDINDKITKYELIRPLPGISSIVARDCFIRQVIDSIKRIKYVTVIRDKVISPICADATNDAFDPLKAASWHKKQGYIDEACWLVLLSIHFGKNLKSKWRLVQNIYGGLGNAVYWDWEKVKTSPGDFLQWLDSNQNGLKAIGSFGNHRKYQSLDAFKPSGTGATITSYVDWVETNNGHQNMINTAITKMGENPRQLFQYLYNSMNNVIGFGRTAKFDFLTMLGKLELAPIEPGSTYMTGATGPLTGSRLLFGINENPTVLNSWLIELEAYLELYFGMQVLEDAICNWQKSPTQYRYFGG
jgi:hypothetical protein